MAERTFQQLRKDAKAAGINTWQMDRPTIERELLAAAGRGSAPETTNDQPSPRAKRADTREETGRRSRVPLGTLRPKLDYPSRPGYVRRFFNDVGNRIHDAGQAGYEFVEEDVDGRSQRVSRRVGTNEDGTAMIAHLMEIREEFYNEDQAVKAARLDEMDAQMNRDNEPIKADAKDAGKFYGEASMSARN